MAERKAAVLKVFDMFFALRSGLEKRRKRIMELVEGKSTKFEFDILDYTTVLCK